MFSSEGKVSLQVKVPDTITSWVTTAFAVHEESGIGVTEDAAQVNTLFPIVNLIRCSLTVMENAVDVITNDILE